MRLCRWSCQCGKSWKTLDSSWTYYQHWQEHQISCCEVGRDTEKGHCSLSWLQKKTNWTFQGNGNQQISFVRYHRKRGGSHLLAKYKTCLFWWKVVKVMRRRCHSKLTEHVAFLARIYSHFLGIGHIRFGHPHEIIEWVICSQGCFNTKFRNQFDSEVPVDST